MSNREMYTQDFWLVAGVVGFEWATVLAEKVRLSNKSRCRLQIPFEHQSHKTKGFFEFVGDDNIANQLIKNMGGERPKVIKYAPKELRNAIKDLRKAGWSNSRIAGVIRVDCEFMGYQDRTELEVNENQLSLV